MMIRVAPPHSPQGDGIESCRSEMSLWLARLPGALKDLREASGLSPQAAAKRARKLSAPRMTGSTIARWEAGKFAPSMKSLFALLEIFDASLHDLAHALAGTNAERKAKRSVRMPPAETAPPAVPDSSAIESPGTESLEAARLEARLRAQQSRIRRLEAELREVRNHIGLSDPRVGLFGYKVEKA